MVKAHYSLVIGCIKVKNINKISWFTYNLGVDTRVVDEGMLLLVLDQISHEVVGVGQNIVGSRVLYKPASWKMGSHFRIEFWSLAPSYSFSRWWLT